MSEPEIITFVSKEIGKLKGNIRYLWESLKQSQLDRNDCKNIILEIRKSLKILWGLVLDAVLEVIRELEPEGRLFLASAIGKDPEEAIKERFEEFPYEEVFFIIISMLDSPQHYKDEKVKETIIRLIEILETMITKLELKLNLKQGVYKISEFLTTFSRFSENWAVALCYLTSMEIMVKDKLKKLGLEVEEEFKKNYEKVLKKLKEESIQVSELEKRLPNIFWEIRNKVVHEGYSPTSDELETIIKYVEKVLTLLSH
jgi:hypothetical protein